MVTWFLVCLIFFRFDWHVRTWKLPLPSTQEKVEQSEEQQFFAPQNWDHGENPCPHNGREADAEKHKLPPGETCGSVPRPGAGTLPCNWCRAGAQCQWSHVWEVKTPGGPVLGNPTLLWGWPPGTPLCSQNAGQREISLCFSAMSGEW